MQKEDLISRRAAVSGISDLLMLELKGERLPTYNEVYRAIYKLPPAQPETAKRIVGKSRDGMTLWYQCDMRNEPVDVQDNYCRVCGRRLI